MALRAFLIAHKLPQYEECFLGAGFDDVAAFATYDGEDVNTMEQTLHAAGVLPGHVDKIMRTVRDCQDKEVRRKPGESPLKFNYGKQMPLLETLRDEVRALKEEVRLWRAKACETELVMLEEHGKWQESAKLDKGTLRSKNVPSLGSNTGPNAVRRI